MNINMSSAEYLDVVGIKRRQVIRVDCVGRRKIVHFVVVRDPCNI
jgi:hypothetical protein